MEDGWIELVAETGEYRYSSTTKSWNLPWVKREDGETDEEIMEALVRAYTEMKEREEKKEMEEARKEGRKKADLIYAIRTARR